MSTFEDFWNQLEPVPATAPLSHKEAQFQLLDNNTDKLNLSPDEEYRMGWGPDAMSEDWINQKAKAIQKNINDSSSIAVLRKGMEQAATPSPVADAAQAAAKTGNSVDGVSQSGSHRFDGQDRTQWSAMTPAEQAKWYSENPTMAKITQLGQDAFGMTGIGKLQAKLVPDFVANQRAVARGVDPAIDNGVTDARDAMVKRLTEASAGGSKDEYSPAPLSDPSSSGYEARKAGYQSY